MIETVKINDIKITSGMSKKGRGYNMVILNTDGGSLSMYCDKEWGEKNIKTAEGWKVGDEVTVNIEQNGEYLNFDIPSKTEIRFEELEKRVTMLEEVIKNAQKKKVA